MKSEDRAVAAIFLLAYARVWLNLSLSLALAEMPLFLTQKKR